MKKVLTSSLVLTSCAAAVLAASAPALASPAAGNNGSGSPEQSATTVLTGQLMRNGKPVSGEVMVQVWPSASSLVGLKEGEQISTPVVQRTAASGGKFTVTVDPALLPSRYKGTADQVDLQITVTDGQEEGTWFTSALRSDKDASLNSAGRHAGWVSTADRRSTAPDSVLFDLGRRSADSKASPRANT